ncbi:hypothetical protein ACLB0R_04645 [Sphingomonas sp. GlSt437]|uniref:hypothetical protein n=1 Tax=Sphingomonas sp. GlSt437 TaxID=3389970 RepID=UPI003A86B7C9
MGQSVVATCLLAMLASVAGMAGGSSGMVTCFFVIACLVVGRGLAVVTRGVVMMFSCSAMMVGALMTGHWCYSCFYTSTWSTS